METKRLKSQLSASKEPPDSNLLGKMSKATGREYFECSEHLLTDLLASLLLHSGFKEIKPTATGIVARLPQRQKHMHEHIALQFKLQAKFTPQGAGTNAVLVIEETDTDWTDFACDALCKTLLAGLHLVFEVQAKSG